MTLEESIKLARKAGGTPYVNRHYPGETAFSFGPIAFEDFVNLLTEKATEEANARSNASWTLMCKKMLAAERVACVQIVEREASQYTNPVWAVEIVNDIFERGQE